MNHKDKLLYQVLDALENNETSPDLKKLNDITRAFATGLSIAESVTFTEDDLKDVTREAQTKFDIRMGLGSMFKAKDYAPWLTESQGSIDWFFWNRYKKQLLKNGFPPQVARSLDRVTDKILDHLENPLKDGGWARKGMVVGHVQSGKTANYIGLLSKGADAGYKVIIVLAGILNSLRNQTQGRIDHDFIGKCSRTKRFTGVSNFGTDRKPISFTTTEKDFHKPTADSIGMGLSSIKDPVVFVLKKNKSTLENLYKWLSELEKQEIMNAPMLLIDDEADHASINSKPGRENSPTAINYAIRNLLSLFPKSSYVGYTATPFANIFIDPESESTMQNGELYKDLFPRDFILSLDPPDNYLGPNTIFSDEGSKKFLRAVDDHEDILPLRHKISDIIPELPNSLIRALNAFIIAKAIRLFRGQTGKHNSMMINVSRFTDIQDQVSGLTLDYIKTAKNAVTNFSGLPFPNAIKNSIIKKMHQVWEEEFSHNESSWDAVQDNLKRAIDPIEVLTINGKSTDALDFNQDQYPKGRSVIAIGGLGLSRGLTLEGLIVSYFLRNSMMYDTLLQMGRWFGYRDGYLDLCRIFLTQEASSWYQHITESTEELRSDFRDMEKARLTPMDFGLKVRSHPTALIVTARNKMRTAKDIPVQIALGGRLVETSVLLGDNESLNHNFEVLKETVIKAQSLQPKAETSELGYIWKSLPANLIKQSISSFRNHPECMLTDQRPLLQYIEWLEDEGNREFDILLRSVKSNENILQLNNLEINCIRRRTVELSEHRIEFSKRRIAGLGDERAGLTKEEVLAVKEASTFDVPPR
jgi:hypothetical protein